MRFVKPATFHGTLLWDIDIKATSKQKADADLVVGRAARDCLGCCFRRQSNALPRCTLSRQLTGASLGQFVKYIRCITFYVYSKL